MTYVLILLGWVFVALFVSMAFGAICRAGSDARAAPFSAMQHPNVALRGHTPFPR